MAQSPLGAQFHDTVALAALKLRRFSDSDDVEKGLALARERGVVNEDDARFIRECFIADEQLKAHVITPSDLSYEQADRLHRCIDALRS